MSQVHSPARARPAQRVLIVIENMSFTYDTRVRNIARTLARAGCVVWVISPRYPGDPLKWVGDGVTSIHYPMLELPSGVIGHLLEYALNFLSTAAATVYAFCAMRFDVVHICNPPDMFFALGGAYRALGRCFVFDLHDLCPELWEARFKPSRGAQRVLLAMERWTVRAASHVIVTSETTRERICARTGIAQSRITLVRNGPNLARFPAPAWQPRSGPIEVGYIGDMNPQDGIDNLLLAAYHTCHHLGRGDIHYVLIGDGGAFEALKEKAAQLRLASVVTFTGRLVHAEAMQRLSRCALCIQPDSKNSFNDSCVMVKSLEYMALGKPLVAFDLTETRRVCAEAALYASDNDPCELARHVVRLADDPKLCEALGQLGRRRVEEQFAWSFSERQLLSTYASLRRGARPTEAAALPDAPRLTTVEAVVDAKTQVPTAPAMELQKD